MTDSDAGPVNTPLATGGGGRMNFADKYRPKTFPEVFGQKTAVGCLSGLIERGRVGRHILLHGAVGSGKTTLARIYARALNCEAPDPRHAPCGHCRTCLGSSIGGFDEFNVSRYGGKKEAIKEFVDQWDRDDKQFRFRVLFFDEAHALTKEACDLLLNHLEQPDKNVLFFFATTEAERLRPALRSRLFDLLIRPLSISDAIAFLRKCAQDEGVSCEPGALELLAGLRNPYPRDLLLGLERVYEARGAQLTCAEVKAAFDVDQTTALVAYFDALAAGDLGRQTDLWFGWEERAVNKVRWIQAFLLHLYHNEILGRTLIVDGVIESIPESARRRVLETFRDRHGLVDDFELAPLWCRMMDFWPVPETAVDETALGLRVTLFHQLVNAAPADGSGNAGAQFARSGPSIPPRAVPPTARTGVASQGFGPPPTPRPDAPIVEDQDGYLTPADVRRIIHAASFLIQGHRLLFNVAFEIRPALLGVTGLDQAVTTIAAFRDELAAQTSAWTGKCRPSITVLERDECGPVGRLVAHIHPTDPLSSAATDFFARIEAWARAWRKGAGFSGAVDCEPAPLGEKAALVFHWAKVLDLCAGLNPDVEAWDPATERYRPLFKLLRIRSRNAGPIFGHPLVEIPAPLSDDAIAQACRNGLEPLSAFDGGLWDEIAMGWELREYEDRQVTLSRRDHEVASINDRFGENTPEALAALKQIAGAWQNDPRRRSRRAWWPPRSQT